MDKYASSASEAARLNRLAMMDKHSAEEIAERRRAARKEVDVSGCSMLMAGDEFKKKQDEVFRKMEAMKQKKRANKKGSKGEKNGKPKKGKKAEKQKKRANKKGSKG